MATIGTIGAKLNLLVRQAMTFGPYLVTVNKLDVLPKTPIDLTGCIVSGQLRKVLPVTVPPLPLPDPNDVYAIAFDIIVVDALNGKFSFGLSSAKTDQLYPGLSTKDAKGKYEYDIQIKYLDGTIRPLLYGTLTSYREVTRDV
jgi:hypothetical protein